MDTDMGETGEGTDEVKHASSDLCGAKLNGDMNGAYEDEPMDVSESVADDLQNPVKKPISVCSGGNSDNTIGNEIEGEEKGEDVPNCEVPKNELSDVDNKCISSNGYSSHDNDLRDSDNRVSESIDCVNADVNDRNDGAAGGEAESPPVATSDVGNNGVTDSNKEQNENSNRLDRSSVNVTEKHYNESNSNVDELEIRPVRLEPNTPTLNKTDDNCDDNSEKEISSSDDVKSGVDDSVSNDINRENDVEEDEDDPDDDDDDDDYEDDDGKSEDMNKGESLDKEKPGTTIIDIDVTPEKSKKQKKSAPITPVTPRRSSRNLNKQKSYIEKEEKDVPFDENEVSKNEDPDIEEIQPQDPLADIPIDKSRSSSKKTTIVVNDTKRLAEIAAGSKNSKSGKKEPTLVIIDTNSILSGRGPVPLSSHPAVVNSGSSLVSGPPRNQNPAYSVLPITLPAQGLYPSPPSMRSSQTTIKQIPVSSQPSPVTPPVPQKPPVVLPSLTDDMYVVEAPSFIVPYVYEKPPIKPLKEYVDKLEVAVKELRLKLEKEEKERKEKEEKERLEKQKEEGEKMETDKEKDESVDEKVDNDKLDSSVAEKRKTDKDDEMEVDEGSDKELKEKDKVKDEKEDEKIKDKVDADDKPKDLTKDKEKDEKPEGTESTVPEVDGEVGEKKKSGSTYFDNALGKFFMQIGINLVQEHVQTDLLRTQKRKRDKEGNKCAPDIHMAINSLMRTLEFSKENNEPFKMELKKCEFCSFKTESQLVMAHHLETPHMRNYVYRCNFCTLEVRSPHDILFHMEAEHNVRGRLERAPAFHQCPSCPFEDNQKGKLTRHLLSCAKKYRPERNQEPPLDWEPPAKIPRVPRNRPTGMSPGSALYQAAMSGLKQGAQAGVPHPLLPKLMPSPNAALGQSILNRGRGRPQLANRYIPDFRTSNAAAAMSAQQKAIAAAQMRPGMVYRPSGTSSQPQVLLPTSYQIAGNQIYQVVGNQGAQGQVPMVGGAPRLTFVPPSSAPSPTPTPVALVSNVAANSNSITIQSSSTSATSNSSSSSGSSSSSKQGGAAAAAKLIQQPSISITPLPRQQPSTPPTSSSANPLQGKPGRPLGSGGKATFVICEICDGYIKDLELLRNHMQWIHKVKIHPKMIYNRPPLNCQKCQFRFFTDQGLERHLLGSHGLVTSSMQEAANKGKDGGRCPVCGRVYQWKLLNHVARDHNMSLKPAHLSYKCTVCTATFGMYKQFENHVYSAHSVVAKRVMDKKSPSTTQQPSTSSSQGDSLLKPLKINDEITIIPQPPRSAKTKSGPTRSSSSSSSGGSSSSNSKGKV